MTVPTRQWTVDEVPETEDEEQLIARYIKPHPHKHGRAYAYLFDFGPSVSAIIRALQAGNGEVAETAASWNVPEDAVRAAIAFYRRHREYIDARHLLEDDQFESELAEPRGRLLSRR